MQNPYIPMPVEVEKIVTEVDTNDIKTFRLTFDGVKGPRVEAMDVMSGDPVSVRTRPLERGRLEVTLPVTTKPVLLPIQN